MSNYVVSDTNLTAVANAIRQKGGTSASLEFPDDFIEAIGNIQTGSGEPMPPAEYQVVEYIEATGTQYIDTGVLPTENNAAEIVFELTGYVATNYIGLVSASTHMYLVHFAHSSGSSIHFLPSWYTLLPNSSTSLNLNTKYHAVCSIGNTSDGCGGCAAATEGPFGGGKTNTATYTPTNNFYIFARNSGNNSVSYQAKAKLYSLKMYTDGVLCRNFIPCYRKVDNVIGLYDVVNSTFYTNIGSGTFGKGNNV